MCTSNHHVLWLEHLLTESCSPTQVQPVLGTRGFESIPCMTAPPNHKPQNTCEGDLTRPKRTSSPWARTLEHSILHVKQAISSTACVTRSSRLIGTARPSCIPAAGPAFSSAAPSVARLARRARPRVPGPADAPLGQRGGRGLWKKEAVQLLDLPFAKPSVAFRLKQLRNHTLRSANKHEAPHAAIVCSGVGWSAQRLRRARLRLRDSRWPSARCQGA